MTDFFLSVADKNKMYICRSSSNKQGDTIEWLQDGAYLARQSTQIRNFVKTAFEH